MVKWLPSEKKCNAHFCLNQVCITYKKTWMILKVCHWEKDSKKLMQKDDFIISIYLIIQSTKERERERKKLRQQLKADCNLAPRPTLDCSFQVILQIRTHSPNQKHCLIFFFSVSSWLKNSMCFYVFLESIFFQIPYVALFLTRRTN